MFDILEIPKEETKELEQFTPLEQVGESPTVQTDTSEPLETVSKQDYDSLVKTIEELKSLLTTNKE